MTARSSSARWGRMLSLGARLARLTFYPDLLFTDGEALLLADAPAFGEAARSRAGSRSGRVFDVAGLGQAPCGDGRQPG